MKTLHITPAFYPATHWGGPISSLYGLCNGLAGMPGINLKVLTTDTSGPKRSDTVKVDNFPTLFPGPYQVFFCRRWWGASFSPGMLCRMWSMIRWADIVHLTAVYSPPTIPALFICRLLRKPVIWSPRGSLQRWQNSTRPRLKKIWELICNALVSRRRCVLHVTSREEGSDSAARIPNASLIVIPNGVDIPELLPSRVWLPEGKLRLLYLGRLHPIKGLENLLHAMKQVQNTCILTICGRGDDAYAETLQNLIDGLEIGGCVRLEGHVGSYAKQEAFRKADVCVLPSHSENFGMVVAESLAHGVPVIASKGTPWKDIEKHGCGLWVDNSPPQLAHAIEQMTSFPLGAMGSRGRNWMKESYCWEKSAIAMFHAYGRLASADL